MAAKLGSSDVSFRLGAGEVAAVYLGTQEVWSAVPEPVTLYFFYDMQAEEADSAWTTVGNWWLDDEHTIAAGRLPTSADSVVASASITASGQTVVDFTLNDDGSDYTLNGSLIVTGMATFSGFAQQDGTITGNATFNGGTNNGTINGSVTFNENSNNAGTVTGTATFNGSACNNGGTAGTFVPDPPPSCE